MSRAERRETARAVARALCALMPVTSPMRVPIEEIAKATRIPLSRVRRAISDLSRAGYVRKVRP